MNEFILKTRGYSLQEIPHLARMAQKVLFELSDPSHISTHEDSSSASPASFRFSPDEPSVIVSIDQAFGGNKLC